MPSLEDVARQTTDAPRKSQTLNDYVRLHPRTLQDVAEQQQPSPPERRGPLGQLFRGLSVAERTVGVPLIKGAISPFISQQKQEEIKDLEEAGELVRAFWKPDEDAGWGRQLAQLAVEGGASIAADPLTYLTFGGGALVKATVPFTKISKPLIQGEPIRKGLTAAGKALRGTTLGKTFSSRPLDEGVASLVSKYKDLQRFHEKEAIFDLKTFDQEIAETAKRLKISQQEAKSLIRDAAELPLFVGQKDLPSGLTVAQESLPKDLKEALLSGKITGTKLLHERTLKNLERLPELRPHVEKLRAINDAQLAQETLMGLKVGPLIDDVEYLVHTLTPEARKALEEIPQFKGASKTIRDTHASMLSRSLEGLTIGQVNEAARQGILRINGFPLKVEKFFVDDPIVAQAVRTVRHIKAVSGAKLLDEAAKFGVPHAQAPASWARLDQVDRLKGLSFNPEVAKGLLKAQEAITDVKEMRKWLTMFDSVQGWWKAWSLGIFPAYHSRNAVSNLWNNWLAGVDNPVDYLRALHLQTQGAGANVGKYRKLLSQLGSNAQTVGVKGQAIPLSTALQEALRRGVVGRGWYAADIPKLMEQELNSPVLWSKLLPGRNNALLQAGMRGGEFIENNARLAHYLGRLRKGDSFEEAAASVKKFLFDYDELTPIERGVFRRMIPFYTWTRKNLPLQAEMLVKEPRKFAAIEKGVQALERQNEPIHDQAPDERYMSEWMKANYPVRVRQNSRGSYEYFLLGSWLPAADLQKLISPLKSGAPWILSSLSPALTTGPELLANQDVYFRKEIERFPGEPKEFLGQVVRGNVAHLGRKLRILNDLDKALRQDVPVDTKILHWVTGKLYPYDEQKSKIFYQRDVKREILEIQTAMRKATREKRGPALREALKRRLQETRSRIPHGEP